MEPVLQKEFYQKWMTFIGRLKSPEKEIEIAVTGKYTTIKDSYLSILKALEHVSAIFKCKINVRWIETSEIKSIGDAEKTLKGIKGIIVPGGFGSRGIEGKILCIQYARENNIPFLGLCYGMQLATIEYSRNVCGLVGANTTEINPRTNYPVVSILDEQKNVIYKGGTMRLGRHETIIQKGSYASKIYGKEVIGERFRHRYEVNPKYLQLLSEKGLVFSGISKEDKNIMQILELPKNKHKFFFATQFHPELTSRPLSPSPAFLEFVKNCLN